MALRDAGYTVKAVCAPEHPLHTTDAVKETFVYRGLMPLVSFEEAIEKAAPDYIIPGDDLAVQHLHQLYARKRAAGSAGAAVCALIERSLGDPSSFPVVYSRGTFISLAEEEGVRIPKSQVISNLDELRDWGNRMGYPAVLKADGSWGGEGVRVVRSQREAERAFRKLQAPPIVARAMKRAILDRDMTLVLPMLTRRRTTVNAQAFIAGHEATSLVACWKGEVLASLHFEVLCKQDPTKPASVVRMIEDPDMISGVEKMVRRLNLSGFAGFDFMIEKDTGHSYMIEVNPRPTQVGHLRLGAGRDLPAALYAAMTGSTIGETVKVTDNNTIAFFPQEWLRNPASPYLRSAYHDVPLEEPALLRMCVKQQRKWTTWFSQRKSRQAFSEAWLPRS
jgi:carbamoylphosphate synthase large subunit